MDAAIAQKLQTLSIIALPIVVAITFHEAAHGFVADKKGDPTARLLGRLTLNPLPHIDPIGTVLVPALLFFTSGFLFGWAKPVPVNFMNLHRPKTDMAWVAAAGPATNLGLAIVSGLLFRVLIWLEPDLLASLQFSTVVPDGDLKASILLPLALMLVLSVQINILLMLFNLLPIPPLDGGRVAVGLLPARSSVALSQLEPFGMFIIIFLVIFNPLGFWSHFFRPMVNMFTSLILG
jgi:Zn-dependent protease